jgi:hypothetical protein
MMAFTWAWTFGQKSGVHWFPCLNSCVQIRRTYRRVLSRDVRFPQRYWWRFKPYGMWHCVAIGTTILRNFGNCAPRDSVNMQRTCIFMIVLWLYPTCSRDLTALSMDITGVTSDNRSVPEAKIWNISGNIWRIKTMPHFLFFYRVTPVVGFYL